MLVRTEVDGDCSEPPPPPPPTKGAVQLPGGGTVATALAPPACRSESRFEWASETVAKGPPDFGSTEEGPAAAAASCPCCSMMSAGVSSATMGIGGASESVSDSPPPLPATPLLDLETRVGGGDAPRMARSLRLPLLPTP